MIIAVESMTFGLNKTLKVNVFGPFHDYIYLIYFE
jgi:hypothetical protein